MPSDAILHEAQQLHHVSDRTDLLADEHPVVSEALIISGNVRHTATLLEVLVVTKMGPLGTWSGKWHSAATSSTFLKVHRRVHSLTRGPTVLHSTFSQGVLMARSKQFPFETIVVATDFSEKSSATLRYAQAIACLHGAKLVLVHVIDPIGYAFPKGVPSSVSADQAAREELNRIEGQVRSQGIAVHSIVETGDICELILQTVRDHGGDLLVLGTRGKTGVGRTALGAIARQLLARTECPILTVTPDVELLMPWAGRWRTVLLATDFSSCSLAALTAAHRIAHAQLTVLHSLTAENDVERHTHLERLRFLAPMNESHTVPVKHVVTSGEAGHAIVDFALEHQVDLVVLGSPETMLSEEDMVTSTVLQVISGVHCPVLCIPAPHQEKESTTSATRSEREENGRTRNDKVTDSQVSVR
jgi:nucleotide-binding universal stress UspA family protein